MKLTGGFQSTRPRGARLWNQTRTPEKNVSIHAPAWGATPACPPRASWLRCFNPRARVGRDGIAIFRFSLFSVSIHAPAWGATRTSLQSRPRSSFNPRARVGRDHATPVAILLAVVSIHAPAWGATRLARQGRAGCDVSIHAPAWGATGFWFGYRCHVGVSIHAPAWGATAVAAGVGATMEVSIHAPAWGATWARHQMAKAGAFQSTRPRGARPRTSKIRGFGRRFNPRARVGRDIAIPFFGVIAAVSIHAPAWGATLLTVKFDECAMFQSTRPRGARRVTRRGVTRRNVSIHAPAWGATRSAGI